MATNSIRVAWLEKGDQGTHGGEPRTPGGVFTKTTSCLTILVNFYDEMTEGRAMNIVYLDFSRGFDTVSHNIFLLDKLLIYGLDKHTVRWFENGLTG